MTQHFLYEYPVSTWGCRDVCPEKEGVCREGGRGGESERERELERELKERKREMLSASLCYRLYSRFVILGLGLFVCLLVSNCISHLGVHAMISHFRILEQ